MTTPARSRQRGPYARSAERREAIAAAVLEIVVEKGHRGVTTAEVAERAGAREPTVLYHFPSKDHLLVAALRRSDEEQAEADDGGDSDAGLPERLRAFADSVTRRAGVLRLYAALAGEATTPGHPAQEYFAQRYAATVARHARMIERRQEAGLAPPGLDPVQVARQFLATWDGLQLQWLADPSFDLGEVLVAAFRRLTGEDRREARASLTETES
ncbi:TetR/AcrR family transcriptional regulator [Actinocorallia longicatena]|uniref:TetR/AcrR family transcriptional regulator n=1 Tax=Actinocorallia longicatena TaxID=111803 RepID=A0ABP6PZH7_9ACTN